MFYQLNSIFFLSPLTYKKFTKNNPQFKSKSTLSPNLYFMEIFIYFHKIIYIIIRISLLQIDVIGKSGPSSRYIMNPLLSESFKYKINVLLLKNGSKVDSYKFITNICISENDIILALKEASNSNEGCYINNDKMFAYFS